MEGTALEFAKWLGGTFPGPQHLLIPPGGSTLLYGLEHPIFSQILSCLAKLFSSSYSNGLSLSSQKASGNKARMNVLSFLKCFRTIECISSSDSQHHIRTKLL